MEPDKIILILIFLFGSATLIYILYKAIKETEKINNKKWKEVQLKMDNNSLAIIILAVGLILILVWRYMKVQRAKLIKRIENEPPEEIDPSSIQYDWKEVL